MDRCRLYHVAVFPRKGESPKEANILLIITVTELKVLQFKKIENTKGSESKSSLLFSLLLLLSLQKAWCDFLNTANEKKLDFHRPADLLTAGVSQIQFQMFFSLPSAPPS